MSSIAEHQFPIIVWRDGAKRLWNPIHRKALKNRPEERVRLRIIEYLLQAGWSKHRISTEEAIRDYTEASLRTDLICYSQDFEPRILVECKAENISLTNKTGQQVARYNQQVHAPVVLISNGRRDYWYSIEKEYQKVTQLGTAPEFLPRTTSAERDFSYWKKRGFAGEKAKPGLRSWLEPLFQDFATISTQQTQYLQFNKSPSDIDLNHYYHISGLDHRKIALSFLGTSFGGSRLIAILNKAGENKAVLEVNLDLVFNDEHPNASVYSAKGIRNIDLAENLNNVSSINNLLKLLESVFIRQK